MDQRILSAVMFTDIVGYSALASRNEEEALALVRINRNHQKPIIDKYGTFLKEMGDGVLARFSSAFDSIQCAIEIQEKAPIELKDQIRIGIHLGDVSENNGDIFGDGVNIASRLESKAKPGSIYFSDSVYNAIKGRGDVKAKYVGTFKLKNLKDPIRTYTIVSKAQAESESTYAKMPLRKVFISALTAILISSIIIELAAFLIARNNLEEGLVNILILVLVFAISGYLLFILFRGKRFILVLFQIGNILLGLAAFVSYFLHPLTFDPSVLRLVDLEWESHSVQSQNSVVLLPISNYIGADKEYMIAGIHEGLINGIGKLGSIRVISRTSTLPYANAKKSLKTIAEELHVDMVVESSVSKRDTLTEITIKLINPFPEEKIVWLNSYLISISEISQLYDEVIRNLELKINDGTLSGVETESTSSGGLKKTNTEAWEYFHLASFFIGNMTMEGFDKAEAFLNKAIEIDSTFSPAYSGLSFTWMSRKQMGFVSTMEAEPIIRKYVEKAMQLDNQDAAAWGADAALAVWTDYDFERGEKSFLKAIALNPNMSMNRAGYAHLLMILNRWEEAWAHMHYALAIDPLNPMVIAFSGIMYSVEGKFLSATKKFETITAMVPDHQMANFYLFQKYSRTFQHSKAIEELKKLVMVNQFPGLEESIDKEFAQNGYNATLRFTAEFLEEQSKSRWTKPGTMAVIYELLNDSEGRIIWIEKMYELNSGDLPYFAIKNDQPIQEDPRYIAVMKKAGLW